jgi:hypothetical protein
VTAAIPFLLTGELGMTKELAFNAKHAVMSGAHPALPQPRLQAQIGALKR